MKDMKKLGLMMALAMVALNTFAQNSVEKLMLPELFDFILLKCDYSDTVRSEAAIDAAFERGISSVYTAGCKQLDQYVLRKGMVPVSNYTMEQAQRICAGLKGTDKTRIIFSRQRTDRFIRAALLEHCYVDYDNDTVCGLDRWTSKLIASTIDVRTRIVNHNRLVADFRNKGGIPYFITLKHCGALKPEKETCVLAPLSVTTLFFDAENLTAPKYEVSATVANVVDCNQNALDYTFTLNGMNYLLGSDPKNVYAIIPQPLSLHEKEGQFVFDASTRIVIADKRAKEPLEFLTSRLADVTGLQLKAGKKVAANGSQIVFKTSVQNDLGDEGYRLQVEENGITVEACGKAGFFYAVQTIFQLMPAEIYSHQQEYREAWTLPCVEIKDVPRFKYRGMHLDVCRHMFPISFVKKYIDLLSMQKMNRFHWHLTDDQGWRIEIKKYPKLTRVGAYRKETVINEYNWNGPNYYDGKRYGGFYTQQEIKEVVEYARRRCVTVIPEIDLPGHMLAALAAYPEMGCTGGPYEVGTRWGIYEDVLCAGNEKIYTFIEDVMSEVMQLFPGEYIHIGGDECFKTRWKACHKCQDKIKQKGLKDEHELQSYVIKRVEKYLNQHGKKIIGWDEILEGGIAPNAAVMSWRGMAGGIVAAKSKHEVVMTPNTHLYLDHYQANMDLCPLSYGRINALEWTYSYEPIPEELTAEEAKYVMGVQGNIWTEYIRTVQQAEHQAYPRANAVAEIGWSMPENRNWNDFYRRIQYQFERWRYYGVNYALHYRKR